MMWIDGILELAQEAGLNTLRATNWIGQAGPDPLLSSPVYSNLDHLLRKVNP